jgi:hypothetical protein
VPRRFASRQTPEEEERRAVLELLALYRRAREEARSEGHVVAVEVADPVLARRDGRRTLRGLRPFVLYALDDHVARRVRALRRRLHERAVDTGAVDADLLARCDHLEQSLRPVPYRRLLALLIVAVPAVALGLIGVLRGEEAVRSSLLEQLDDASSLVSALAEQLLTLDVTDIPTVLEQIAARPLKTIVFVVLIVLLAIYVTLRPLVSSFRVKRALLSDGAEHDFRTAAGGAYRLEARVLGPAAARETPLDLQVLALPMLLPLYVGLYIIGSALLEGPTAPALVAGLIAAAPPAARLVFLRRTALRRAADAGHDGTFLPPRPEVSLPAAAVPAVAGPAVPPAGQADPSGQDANTP